MQFEEFMIHSHWLAFSKTTRINPKIELHEEVEKGNQLLVLSIAHFFCGSY